MQLPENVQKFLEKPNFAVLATDPRNVPSPRHHTKSSYEEMVELAAWGAKVLRLPCVQYARRYNVRVHVRPTSWQKEGGWVVHENRRDRLGRAQVSGGGRGAG